jgi:hypothetical protein
MKHHLQCKCFFPGECKPQFSSATKPHKLLPQELNPKIMTSTRLKPSTATPISTLEKITHNTSRATGETKNLNKDLKGIFCTKKGNGTVEEWE